MKEKYINSDALLALIDQNWDKAQELFYQNAIENPSHKTYNNLGHYLWSEGLICKDGKHRNAKKLGLHYIIKSSELGVSAVNCCAVAEAADHAFFYDNENSAPTISFALDYLEKVLRMDDAPDIRYNYYRFLYLLSPSDEIHLARLRELVIDYATEESVGFYFNLLCIHSKKEEGLECIARYGDMIDESDLLHFYAKMGLYDEGIAISEAVCDHYCIDESIAAAVIECSLGANDDTEGKRIGDIILAKIRDESDFCNTGSGDIRFNKLITSRELRRELLDVQFYVPPMISCCCYFGCNIHNTAW